MSDDFWEGLITGVILAFFVMFVIGVLASPTLTEVAQEDCNKFSMIYSGQFFVEEKECIFKYEDAYFPVEWDSLGNHQTIQYILGSAE